MSVTHDYLVARAGTNFRLGSGIDEVKEHELFAYLCTFINENALSHEPLTIRSPCNWEGFELRFSHLTDLGLLVMKEGLHRWLAAIDRGTPPAKSKILLRALEKCQSQRAEN